MRGEVNEPARLILISRVNGARTSGRARFTFESAGKAFYARLKSGYAPRPERKERKVEREREGGANPCGLSLQFSRINDRDEGYPRGVVRLTG